MVFCLFFFFFQAEDGIRDLYVTGVQTCALPISRRAAELPLGRCRRARHPGIRERVRPVERRGLDELLSLRGRQPPRRRPRGQLPPRAPGPELAEYLSARFPPAHRAE